MIYNMINICINVDDYYDDYKHNDYNYIHI